MWNLYFYYRVVSTRGLVPLQGASVWVEFPGLKPWAESCTPFGACTGLSRNRARARPRPRCRLEAVSQDRRRVYLA